MFRMLTKQDRSYIDNLLDSRFADFEIKMDAKFEALAIMIQTGFSECVTKTEFNLEINNLKSEMDDRFNVINERLNSVDNCLYNLEGKVNTMEFKLITAPNNRLDKLEDDVRQIKAKIGIA